MRLSRLYFEKDTEPYARSRDVQVECLAKVSGFRHVLHSFRAFLQYSVPNDSGRSRLQMYVLRNMCNLHILKPGQICLPEHVSHDLSFMPGKLEEHRVSIVSWTRSISK